MCNYSSLASSLVTSSLVTLEVTELLSKGAIVETQLTPHSFISHIFLVEKKDGGQRPVINLKGLNQLVSVEHFKMKVLHLLPGLLQSGDWMVKMDLKDAYLQVTINPCHQPLLSFLWEGKYYMFTLRSLCSTKGIHQTSSGLPPPGGMLSDNIDT